ncbi:MAG: OB-fold domain-containing protein [Parvularculaceae bacterium]
MTVSYENLENAVAPDVLVTIDGALSLVGSRCVNCGEYFFPIQQACAACSSQNMKTVSLGDEGVLWSWTVQRFPPKPPFDGLSAGQAFSPYAVGYVEMASGVKVESRLVSAPADDWRIGMKLRLVAEAYATDDTGRPVITYAFEKGNHQGSS